MARSHQHVHKKRVDRREPMPDAIRMPHPFPLVGRQQDSPLEERDATLVDRSPPGSSQETSASTTTDTSSAPSHYCPPGDNSAACERPVDSTNSTTVAIVCGAVIPVVCAIIVFFYLHRRHVKKLRREDAQDKYKSLDFGMDGSDLPTTGKKGKKGKKDKNAPEMMGTDLESEKAFRKDRGMSMDMGSPYLLPPDMQGSRESLHSLSRTIHGGDDRYRPAASFVGNDGASIHSFPSRLGDDSPYSPSNPPKRNISLANKEHDFAFGVDSPPLPEVPEVAHARGNPAPDAATAGLLPPSLDPDTRDSYIVKDGGDLRRSNNYLGAFINDRASSMDPDKQIPKSSDGFPDAPLPTLQQNDERKSPPTAMTARPEVALAHQQSYEAPIIEISEDKEVLDNEFGDGFKVTPPSVHRTSDPNENPFESNHHELDSSEIHAPEALHAGLDAPELGYDLRRLSMGFVPLPPEDPSDDAEQRANRIRSFYKEYFDDSKPGPVGDEYYEDYGESYLGDVAVFDPESGQFIMGGNAPFAQPVTRRAMTPPPRAPPRFQGPPRHGPSMSNGPFMGQVPRAFSSQSGRMGPGPPGARRPGPPRKALPPPSPLRVLPTPHMLKDDSFLPMDFAPPSTAKDRAAGRPSTPTGGLKPYSPMLPAHQPLVSAFDDLAVMPSPHALRRSGTFTALDFAPPPRFRNGDTGSDSGSIKSNRSGVSAAHLHNIRTGAYRVSRLPKETVGTKNDLMAELKPSWSMRMAV